MWIFTSTSFISVVQKPGEANLTVRARHNGEIESLFPGAKVATDAGTDYKYRATIDRETVADTIHAAIMEIEYDNFKNTVKNRARHDAYMGVWSAMMRYQMISEPKDAPHSR